MRDALLAVRRQTLLQGWLEERQITSLFVRFCMDNPQQEKSISRDRNSPLLASCRRPAKHSPQKSRLSLFSLATVSPIAMLPMQYGQGQDVFQSKRLLSKWTRLLGKPRLPLGLYIEPQCS